MFKKFKTKELVFLALFAAFAFLIMFSIGGAINIVTGTPLMGGLVLNIVFSFLIVTALLIVRKFGTATITAVIYSALSVPTVNFGPPGVYKIFIALILGLVLDTILYAGRYKRGSYYISSGLAYLISPPLLYVALVMLRMPAAEKIAGLVIPLMAIYCVEAIIGTFIALKVYNKIKDKKIIKQVEA